MKKFFLTLLAAATVFGMVSCNKNVKPADTTTDPSTEASVEPEEAIITIDGEFEDWAKLKDVVTASVSDDEETYPYLLTMKAIADKEYIYFYFEYEIAEDQTKVAFDLLVDADNDPETGFSLWFFKDCGWEYCYESSDGFLAGGKFKSMNNAMTLYKCEGPDKADRWAQGSQTKTLSTSGTKSKGIVSEGIAIFELSLKREKMQIDGKTIAVGVYTTNIIYDEATDKSTWVENGVLPREDGVASELLEIKLP